MVRIRGRSVLQNGDEVYPTPPDAYGYPHIPASAVYHDWAEDWKEDESRLVPRNRVKPLGPKSESAITRKAEIEAARKFRAKALGVDTQPHRDWADEDDHICLTYYAGMRRQMLVTKTTDSDGNVVTENEQVYTPLYYCAVCRKKASQCTANGSRNTTYSPRDGNNFRKPKMSQRQGMAEIASVPRALITMRDDWIRAMWKVYPQLDQKDMQNMCECSLNWVIRIGEVADARDLERHADERIANHVLCLRKERDCEQRDLLDASVLAPP